MNTIMPLVTHTFNIASAYVTSYSQFRMAVLDGSKLITISQNLEIKQCLALAARLLEDLDIP